MANCNLHVPKIQREDSQNRSKMALNHRKNKCSSSLLMRSSKHRTQRCNFSSWEWQKSTLGNIGNWWGRSAPASPHRWQEGIGLAIESMLAVSVTITNAHTLWPSNSTSGKFSYRYNSRMCKMINIKYTEVFTAFSMVYWVTETNGLLICQRTSSSFTYL